jgi:hypothetical protein
MPTDGSSQLEGLWDSCAGALFNVYDAYAWIVPALLLTILFFFVVAFVCWACEKADFDIPIFEGPAAIFRWCREAWEFRRDRLRISILPSSFAPSELPPSSVLE